MFIVKLHLPFDAVIFYKNKKQIPIFIFPKKKKSPNSSLGNCKYLSRPRSGVTSHLLRPRWESTQSRR